MIKNFMRSFTLIYFSGMNIKFIDSIRKALYYKLRHIMIFCHI